MNQPTEPQAYTQDDCQDVDNLWNEWSGLLLVADLHAEFLRRCLKKERRELTERLVDAATSSLLEKTGKGLQLSGVDFSSCDLSRLNLRLANFNRSNLQRACLDFSNLTGASLISSSLDSTTFRYSNLETAFLHALAAQVCDFTGTVFRGSVDIVGSLFHGCAFKRANLDEINASGASFFQCEFSGCIARGARLAGSKFDECTFEGCKLIGADLVGAVFRRCSIKGTDLQTSKLNGAAFNACMEITDVTFDNCDLVSSTFRDGPLIGVSFQGCNAEKVVFDSCIFEKVSFNCAEISYSSFVTCSFVTTSLQSATLRGARLFKCHGTEIDFYNVVFEDALFLECSFPNGQFTKSSGRGAVFRNCNLSDTRFTDAHLYRAVFSGDPTRAMSLRGANLERANLVHGYIAGDCRGANLAGAYMAYTKLSQCDFSSAILKGAQLFFAVALKAKFVDANLSYASGPYIFLRSTGLVPLDSDATLHDSIQKEALKICESIQELTEGLPKSHM